MITRNSFCTTATFDEDLEYCPTHYFCHNGKYIGSFTLRTWDNTIWSLSIKKEYRNQGYGALMMRELVEKYGKTNTLRLYVYKNNYAAIRIYEKAGFTIVGDYYNDAYEMERKVTICSH